MSDQKQSLIVGVLGSPRAGGNVDLLLDAALQGALDSGASIVKFVLNEMNIRPCQGCGGCNDTGRCVIRDDMDLVYEAIENMDGMVLATPVYFGGATAQAKAMIDRCQPYWSRKYLMKQPVSRDGRGKHRDLLLVAALGSGQHDMVESLRTEARYFVDVFDGQYDDLVFPHLEHAGEVGEHWEAMAQAREAGARLVASR